MIACICVFPFDVKNDEPDCGLEVFLTDESKRVNSSFFTPLNMDAFQSG